MASPDPCRILVMASGNGSNFQALINAVESGRLANSTIVGLIVNRTKIVATQRAEKHNIPWEYFNLIAHKYQAKGEKDPEKIQVARAEYDAALANKILSDTSRPRPDLIVLAGWMHVFTSAFLDPLDAQGIKLINIHPALPGRYDGANAIERAFTDFTNGKLEGNKTGIMVHYVISQVDRGEPILVREIECQDGDDLHQLEERIHSHEHELIVEATARVAQQIVAERAK